MHIGDSLLYGLIAISVGLFFSFARLCAIGQRSGIFQELLYRLDVALLEINKILFMEEKFTHTPNNML
jgi:hypothetical protein